MKSRSSESMHVAKIVRPYKDRVYTYHFLRQTYREGGKVKHRTLANLSHLPEPVIDLVRRALAGEALVPAAEALRIVRSLPHGHVAAVLGTARALGLEQILGAGPGRAAALVLAMVVERVLDPCSKLATAARLGDSTLGPHLGLAGASEDDLYRALDWLLGRQGAIESALARRHLAPGSLVLYDVTSTYVTGRACPLAAHGYSRDRRADREQIVVGLVCDQVGRPLAVEAFPGNTADPATVDAQLTKLSERFGLSEVVLVGDRGMLTSARIEVLRARGGIGWISCLRGPAIEALVRSGELQLSLFDERNLAEIRSSAYPDERLVVCRNPVLAEERGRKRDELLGRTEADLARVAALVARGRLRTAAAIGVRVGRVLDRWKMAKHYELTITDGAFAYRRKSDAIATEAALDGLYVVRTSVGAERLDAPAVVRAYKDLAAAERAFRSLKTIDLEVRPIFHYRADRVRAHLLVCLLAAYVAWHLRDTLAPLLFAEEVRAAGVDPVAPPVRSVGAARKDRLHRTADGELPVSSFRSLLAHLATLTENRVVPAGLDDAAGFTQLTVPTPLQARAFELLGFAPATV